MGILLASEYSALVKPLEVGEHLTMAEIYGRVLGNVDGGRSVEVLQSGEYVLHACTPCRQNSPLAGERDPFGKRAGVDVDNCPVPVTAKPHGDLESVVFAHMGEHTVSKRAV